ncbi:MAG: response regulator transcription factor [Cyclobacteriaceae bacterium]|nr:response regulator transcription factor [Cyclobacteriaceae bacterium]
MIRLALIEDDTEIRNYLKALIGKSDGFEVQEAFVTAEDALQYFAGGAGERIQVVITDIELPGKSGIDLILSLKPHYPQLQIMVLSSYEDSDRIFRALRAGATGYILKNTPAHKLIESIHDLAKGGSPMSSQIARRVVSAFQQDIVAHSGKEDLSMREKEVLHWLAQGYRYQEIADKLFISLETVRTHIRNIYEKLHVHNRKQALKNVGFN